MPRRETSTRSLTPFTLLSAALVAALLAALLFAGPMPAHASTPGTLFAWGDNSDGQGTVPVALAGAQVIAAAGGFYHSLAVKSDGTVVAWGTNYAGQINVPAGLTSVTAVAAGIGHSLALKSDGTIVGWGDNDFGQLNFPAGLTGVTAIAAGYLHSLALKSDGTVVAVGLNDRGQTNVPAGLAGVVAIASHSGADFSLALKSDGAVVGWGDNTFGQLNFPAGQTGVSAIAAGGTFSLLLKNDGTVLKVGGGSAVPAGLTNVAAIAAGFSFGLALKSDGSLVSWGDTSVPPGFANVTAIAAGYGQGLAIGAADSTPPGVTVNQASGQADPTSSNPVLFTANFSEPVTGFTASDVALGGTADRTNAAVTVSGGPSSYAISVEGLTSNGTVIATIPANAAADLARNGNSASTSTDNTVTLNFDNTGPVITPTVVGTPGSNGWYTSDVNVSWSVVDDESTVASQSGCEAQTVTGDTSGVTFTCSAASAGGSSSQSVTVKVDKSAPTISAAATTLPNAAGWYNSNVTVLYSCADNLSGVVGCPAAQVLSSEGNAVASTAQTIVDNAGNSSAPSNVVTVKVDQSAPAFDACPTAGPFGLNSGAQSVGPVAVNADVAGLDADVSTLAGLVDTSSTGMKSVAFSATDNAGNSVTQLCTYQVIDNPPTIAVAPGGVCLSDSKAQGTINLAVGDANSGPNGLVLSLTGNSNTKLLPNANVVFGSSGANRTLTVSAAAKQKGTAVLTLGVSDGTNTATLPVTVIVGTDKKETLNGTAGTDLIFGLAGANTINGGGSSDLLCGGSGADTLNGGDGADTLVGNRGADALNGEGGNDLLTGAQGGDRFSGGADTDTATDFTPSQGDTQDGTVESTLSASGADAPASAGAISVYIPLVGN